MASTSDRPSRQPLPSSPVQAPSESSDVHLQQVDILSFDDFYRAQYRPVLALAWSLTGSRGPAEELAQDAFLDAYRRWERLSRFERPDAWVRRAVANRSVSRFRRSRVEAAGLRRLGSERVQEVALTEPDHMFWDAVRALPRRQAQCVALHYLEDRSVIDIAAILATSPNTVKVHLHRGRMALASRLVPMEDVR